MKYLILALLLPAISMAQIYGGSPAQNAAANFALGVNQAVQNRYAPQYNPQFDYQYQQQLRDQHNLVQEQQRYLEAARQQLQVQQMQRDLDRLNGGAEIYNQNPPGFDGH